jgi:threonyl-tRNA synthetase
MLPVIGECRRSRAVFSWLLRRWPSIEFLKPKEIAMISVILEGKRHEFAADALPVLDLKKLSGVPETPEAPITVARVDGILVDLATRLLPRNEPYEVELLSTDTEEGFKVLRHSTCHAMAQAVERIFCKEKVKFGVGPATDDGFYQDFLLPELTEAHLPLIEAEMQRIKEEDFPFERRMVSPAEAVSMFADDYLKLEIIEGLIDTQGDELLSVYVQKERNDLCRGPHVPRTGFLGAFKLVAVSGAYWRGDARREQLTRVYGIARPTQAQLEEDLRRHAEAERRDHRRLGPALGLFMFANEAPGAPVFLPYGTIVFNELVAFKRELMRKYGYLEIRTPTLLKRVLWERSGHWSHYKEAMFTLRAEDEDYAVKPMNCPGSVLVYGHEPRSYKSLPLRLGEFGLVHRNELSGTLAGLLRVRAFTQDDAHIYLRPEQIEDEIIRTARMYQELYAAFGFEAKVALSTRPEKRMGDERLWDQAEEALRRALDRLGLAYKVEAGAGAFYGPKVDFKIQDGLGRPWQCGTIQVDFQLPEQFELTFTGEDGRPHRPVIIHPAAMGSVERFMAVLIEEFDGALPTWLAPVQVLALPISNKSSDYAADLVGRLAYLGYRAEADPSNERIGRKIRDAHGRKVPYMLIVGPREAEVNAVSLRDRGEKEGHGIPFDGFLRLLGEDVASRRRQPFNADDFAG